MWNLISVQTSDDFHRIWIGKDYTVGRKPPSDIIISNDMSISRKHATLTVWHPENHVGHPDKLPVLKLKDLSKFGTLVGGKKLDGQEVTLKNGDEIQFGSSSESKFRVEYEPFVVTLSSLDAASKKSIKQLVRQLGGHVVSEWRKECQYVVMSKLSVTIKVICALMSMKHVVSAEYLQHYFTALSSGEPVPNPDKYLPPLAESQIDPGTVSFQPSIKRKTLFEGKLFLFLTPKQFKKLSPAIEYGGGIPMLVEEGINEEMDDGTIVQENTCVIHFDPATDQSIKLTKNAAEWIVKVMQLIKKHNRRSIQESEIGFAVLYCSTDKHCNPNSDSFSEISGCPIPPQSFSEAPASISSQVPSSASQMKSQIVNPSAVVNRGANLLSKVKEENIYNPGDEDTNGNCKPGPSKPDPIIKAEPQTPKAPTAVRSNVNEIKGRVGMVSKVESRTTDTQSQSDRGSSKRANDETPEESQTSKRRKVTQATEQFTEPLFDDAPQTCMEDDSDGEEELAAMPVRGRAARARAARVKEAQPLAVPAPEPEIKKKESPIKTSPSKDEQILDLSESRKLQKRRYSAANDGWLSVCAAPKPDSNGKCTSFEEELPVGLVVSEEVSLLVRKPGQRRQTDQACLNLGGDVCIWKGRRIKNFKKFNKIHKTRDLPNIIGGSDLVVYNNASKDHDDWFREERDEESQRLQKEEMAREMFQIEEQFTYMKGRRGRPRK